MPKLRIPTRLCLILTVLLLASAASAQIAHQDPAIKITIFTAPVADGKPVVEKERPVRSFSVSPVGQITGESVLAKTFVQSFSVEEAWRVKIENLTAAELSFFVYIASPDKSCVSVLPFMKFSSGGLRRNAEVPVKLIAPNGAEVSEYMLTNAGGREQFAILASPETARLQNMFMAVEYLAGVTTGRGEPQINDLTGIGANGIRAAEAEGKGEAPRESMAVTRRISVTLGNVHSQSGTTLRPADFYEALLLIAACRNQYVRVKDESYKTLAASWLNNQGLANYQTAKLANAKVNFEQSLSILQSLRKDRDKPLTTEVLVRTNLAHVYASLGNAKAAVSEYETALADLNSVNESTDTAIRRRITIASGLGIALESEGNITEAARQYDTALELIGKHRALATEQATPDSLDASEGLLVNSLGRLAAGKGDYPAAVGHFKRSLELSELALNQAGVASASNNLGWTLVRQNKLSAAQKHFIKSAQLFRDLGNRAAAATALGNLMYVEQKQGLLLLAMIHGKEAVNLLQSIRGEISGIEQQLQRSFLLSREDTYRNLAYLFMELGRLPEAQKVLDMLKMEEYFGFVRRDASEARDMAQSNLAMSDFERQALADYAAFADQLTVLESRKYELDEKRASSKLSEADEIESREVLKKLTTAGIGRKVLLERLKTEFTKTTEDDAKITYKTIETLQAGIRRSGDGVVLVSTYLLTERYRAIVATGNTMVVRKADYEKAGLTGAAVNKKIGEFLQTLKNPKMDPRPLGKELYDIFVKPLEADLKGARARTILWSLDGSLRYIPMGALSPDGKTYLAAKYQNVVATVARTDSFFDAPLTDPWRVLAAGVSREHEGFPALTSVPLELDSIVRGETEASSGVLAGKQLLDSAFSLESLQKLLPLPDEAGKPFNILHFATHFSLGNTNFDSALLLGDGKKLSLFEIDNDLQLDFKDVELLTLSACETGIPAGPRTDRDPDGREIESMGMLAQKKGAKAVLATLWKVADESTQLWMTEFYRLKNNNPRLSKAEAMSLTQKAMIEGKLKSKGNSGGCRAEEFSVGTGKTQFPCDTKAPFSHPYFWSPFVLIGNWR